MAKLKKSSTKKNEKRKCSEPNSHPTTEYALRVIRGDLVSKTCRREKQACQRHIDDLKRQGTEEFPFVFDETRADRIFEWFETYCFHVRGPFSGQPIKLEPFQKFDLGCLFGWVYMDSGRRRFSISFNEVARGNVKSTTESGKALYGMCADAIYPPGHPEQAKYEESPEVECAAVDKEQAKRVWGDAKAMGEKSPEISEYLNINKTYIEHNDRGGWLRPLSKDTKNKDSGAPCLIIIDEYHKWPTSEIKDTLYSGFGKRWQSLLDIITTAGRDAENNPAKIEYDICCQILDGIIIDENYFVMIRELEPKDGDKPGDDPHDELNWPKANPILQSDNDYSRILLDQIRKEHNLAYQSNDPAKILEFLTKRCNLWQTGSLEKYFDTVCMDAWKNSNIGREKFLELVKELESLCGIDMSKRRDLTADGNVFQLNDGRIAICAHGFIPSESVIKHEHGDRVPYRQWIKDGWCTETEGAVTDYDYMKKHIKAGTTDEDKLWKIKEIDYDPAEATHFRNQMVEDGFECVEIRQGAKTLTEPTKRFREMVLEGKIIHDGSPLLTWCISNAYEETNSNDGIKLKKRVKDDTQRIDLIAAVLNAFTRVIVLEPPKKSRYETVNSFKL